MRYSFKFLLTISFLFSSSWIVALAAESKYQDNSIKRKDKTVYTLWPEIPFFPLGDIAQFEKTMIQSRDQVRQMLWGELTQALEKMAAKDAPVEAMLEPMANILLIFDQVHDIHKAKDLINIDKSMEAQFKAAMDRLYVDLDVRDDRRKLQIGGGTEISLLQSLIRGISQKQPLGKPITLAEINAKMALEMFEQIDYVSYGTFSNLGKNNFQLTFHIVGNKNGVSRSFIATGRITDALTDLAKQVFDFFQKNVYPDWETSEKQLSWLPMPINPNKAGYTWEEANRYCRMRGYRLPYSRELVLAETGGVYKSGGISSLEFAVPYSVADKRFSSENYVYTARNGTSTGGPVQGASYSMSYGKFWCVRGAPSEEVLVYENIWSLIRKYHPVSRDIYRALETIRFALGDYGSGGMIYYSPENRSFERMSSLDEALSFLKSQRISIQIPKSLR